MKIRKHARPLGMAAMLALAFMSLPALRGNAHAESACTPQTCGTQTCSWGGRSYGGGDTRWNTYVESINGKPHLYIVFHMCDGFTGDWYLVGRTVTTSGGFGSIVGYVSAVLRSARLK